MTVIRGLAAADNDLPVLLTQLKNACGAGGTIDGDLIEIQGDQIDRIQKALNLKIQIPGENSPELAKVGDVSAKGG